MLRIIAGRSGSGKSHLIHRQICEQAQEKEIILLVPEQSTFQCEKRILSDLGAKKASRVTVLSFRRLYDAVTQKYGGDTGKHISDGVKSVLMSLAAESVSDRLVLYGGRSRRSDFSQLMTDAVNEFKACSVTPDDLLDAAAKTDNTRLQQKLRESAIIYEAYEAMLSSAYADPEDDLSRLYEMLLVHPFFEGKTVFIDSFNGFSGQEKKILECIISQADSVTAALCCDHSTAKMMEHSIFREPDTTLRTLVSLAEKHGAEVLPVQWLEEQKRFASPSIAAVEESVFRFDGDPYLLDDGGVEIYEADDEYDEIRQAARRISLLVRDEGYSCSDITVLLRDADMYRNIILSEFPKYDIPFFMSDPQLLEEKPLIRLILSAFEIVHSSFSTESILTYLKTGLTDIGNNDVYLLENYVYMWDIKGSRWKSPFTMNPEGNSPDLDEKALEHIEDIRRRVTGPLFAFSRRLSDACDGGDISKAVYYLLCDLKTSDRMKELVRSFDMSGRLRQKETEARVWDVTMELLDRMYTVLENRAVDSRRYLELFRLMIKNSPISDIPQTLDHVVVGNVGNIRSQAQKAVFIVGALEGVFPAVPAASGIFSDSERTALIGMDIPLNDAVYGMSMKEKFNAYTALSMPSHRLYISRCLTNSKGDHCEPSVIIREVMAILDMKSTLHRSDLAPEEMFFTPRQSFEECAAMWNSGTSLSATLRDEFSRSPEYSGRYRAVEGFIDEEPYRLTSKAGVKKLFGDKLTFSATQTHSYFSCPFQYFCRFGLKAYPRKKASMDAGMYGSAVHYVLENLLKNEDFSALQQMSAHELSETIKKYIDLYLDDIGGSTDRTSRFMAQFRMIQRNITILLRRLLDEFAESKFLPSDFELEIGQQGEIPEYDLTLPGGEQIGVVGKIDRVDTFVYKGSKYIRIVDYKTGTKKFRLSDVLNGLNIQMLLYLSAVTKNGKEHYSGSENLPLVPAGILYMPSTPVSKTGEYRSGKQQSDALEYQRSCFKMNGLLLGDPEILKAMEEDGKGIFIPAKTAEGGRNSEAWSSLADLESYGRIFSYIDRKLIKMAGDLFDGRIERSPITDGNNDPCKYCDYRTACGYEEGKPSRAPVVCSNKEALDIINNSEVTGDE